jgi:hypothetical protein
LISALKFSRTGTRTSAVALAVVNTCVQIFDTRLALIFASNTMSKFGSLSNVDLGRSGLSTWGWVASKLIVRISLRRNRIGKILIGQSRVEATR